MISAEPEPKTLSEDFAPYGRLIPCELIVTVDSSSIRTPIVGLITEDIYHHGSPGGVPLDECVFIPSTTSRARFGDEVRRRSTGSDERTRVELSEIKLQLTTTDEVLPASMLLARTLELGRRAQDDVKMVVPLELLRQKQETARIFNMVLGSIAVISLLVGGIGIMNVMLATVTERTREIGVRRALGARKKHIVRQFLVEAVVLSIGGGALGVLMGLVIPKIVTALSGSLTFVRLDHVLVSFGISALVGVTFGLYPAWRAANMDPVEALRHE
jgi:putative ABC transport system permease protein